MSVNANPATPRLYFDDAARLDFDAVVTAHAPFGGRPAVVLDRSAFYPESGGQLGDTGRLGDAVVEDTQCDDSGVVFHVLAAGSEAPAVGQTVRGAIDRARRRLHMALHTGQHMLSRAMVDEARAETVSSRLGATVCTLDLDAPSLDEATLLRAERLVASVIEDDLPVRQWFPDADELAALPLRRRPKVSENVRVVDVGGFDVSPCGGTHCARTSQVGTMHILGVERYKGKVRVSFLVGRSALDELRARSGSLVELGRMFTCGPHDVRPAVERLRADLKTAQESLGDVRARWAERVADDLVRRAADEGSSRVVLLLDGEGIDTLRALGGRLSARPGVEVFLASRSDGALQVLVARGPGSTLDCGAWLKAAAAAHGGRGGGRPDRAEGRLPGTVDWSTLVAGGA